MAKSDGPASMASLEEASARAGGSGPPEAPPQPEPESELPSSATFAAEDFLFHLYRGSELLQENRVGDAKEELERALALQPRDVEGQGLLGVVYFRLGHYPRAIKIYREIVRARPDEITPRLNLGLCYLKTGQNLHAREELEDVAARRPDHPRAWGYLGLVYERIGEFEKAADAFERAGQPQMARRMRKVTTALAAPDPPEPAALAEVRQVAGEVMHELEDDVRAFARDAAKPVQPGRWHPVELGEERLPPPSRPSRALALAAARDPEAAPLVEEAPPARADALSPRRLAERVLVRSDSAARIELRSLEVGWIRLAGGFAVRLDHARALLPTAAGFRTSTVHRRARGRDLDEPLGGMRAPLLVLDGEGAVVLAVAAPQRLIVCQLDREFFYVREDRLIGFDVSLRHESGRLPAGSVELVPVVQLSGEGVVALRASSALSAVEVSSEQTALVRASDVVGWIGRLLPQPVHPDQAPGTAPGLVSFGGDGAVFLDPV